MDALGRLEPEYAHAYSAYKSDPSPSTTGALLSAVEPVITLGLRTYGMSEAPTLRGQAKRLALGAFSSYDPSRASLRTHVMSHLQGLQRQSARQSRVLAEPERVGLARGQLASAEAEAFDALGRDPSTAELSDRTGLSRTMINRIRSYHPGVAEGRFAPVDEDSGSEPVIQGKDPVMRLAAFLHEDLDGRDQTILEHSLGLFGAKKLRHGEIAKKLGLSPGAVSQRAERIQSRLDELQSLERI